MSKLIITLKDPNGVWAALDRVCGQSIDLDDTEYSDVVRKHVKYFEVVTIELDSETGEARVIPVSE